MNSALILDCYGGPRLGYGSLGDAVFTAPSGGTVTVTNAANLRDPVAAKTATIAWAQLPRVAAGANAGYYGPVRIEVTGADRLWSGNAWALVNTTLPARCRIEQEFSTGPGAVDYVGGPFLEPVTGVQRCLAFSSQSQAFAGYLGNITGTSYTLTINIYLPFGSGRFALGRLFIGQMASLGSLLSAERSYGAIDYSPRSQTVAGNVARRLRGTARTRSMTLSPTFGSPNVPTDSGVALILPTFLDLVGTSSHVVLCAGAPGATPRGDGPECMHGLFRGAVELTSRPGNRQGAKLAFVETF
jgi:hypothetical protein